MSAVPPTSTPTPTPLRSGASYEATKINEAPATSRPTDAAVTLSSEGFDAFGLPDLQNPLKDANGAPALAPPTAPLFDEELEAVLESLVGQRFDGQKKNAENKIEAHRSKALKANEAQKIKIKEELVADEKAQAAARKAKILGWIGKIVAVVAAVVATVATVVTAGAASPLMALAVIGLVGASISFIDQCVKEKNPDSSFSLSKVLTTVVEGFLSKVGVDKETAGRIGLVVAGGIGIFTGAFLIEPQMLGEMSKGICELAGASDKVKMIVTMSVGLAATVTVGIVMAVAAKKMPNGAINKYVQMLMNVGTSAVQGGTQVASGANTIAQAHYQANLSEISAEKKQIQALLVEFLNGQDQGFEELKKIILMVQASVEDFSEMIGDYYKNTSSIISNLSQSRVSV